MNKIGKILLALLILLIPIQFGLHLWPNFAFIKGVRVDYLSPTIYATDILLMLLVLFRIGKIKINPSFVGGFVVFLIINIYYSINRDISFLKLLKIGELYLLFEAIRSFTKTELNKLIYKPLLFSIILFSLIGLFQVIEGQTLGGLFYYLGERTFSKFSPGIATVVLSGDTLLRAYSTFSHPNSFAGYILVSIFILRHLSRKIDRKSTAYVIGRNLSMFTLVLTFSLGAYVSMAVSYLLTKVAKTFKSPMVILVLLFLLSYFLMLLADTNVGLSIGESIDQRLELTKESVNIFVENPFTGVGANNFIVAMSDLNPGRYFWLLQPVHNIYLLILSETGLIGLVMSFILLLIILNKSHRHKYLNYAMFTILITGLFDHYSLTLQQNLLINTLLIGLIFKENI